MADFSKAELLNRNDLMGMYENYQNARPRWKNHWWDGVETLYKSCADWAKKYILDPVARTLEKIKVSRNRCTQIEAGLFKMTNGVFIRSFVNLDTEDLTDTQKVYLFKFYTKEKELIFNKVGTTVKTCLARLKKEIKEYKDFPIGYVEIHRIYDCGEYPAEGFESYVRAYLIKHHPQAFKKNDRFFSIVVEPDLIDRLYQHFICEF